MNSSARSRLLLALGKKNEELRVKFAGELSRSVKDHAVHIQPRVSSDPDYIPSDQSSDDEESSDEALAIPIPEENDEAVIRELLDDMVEAVVAGPSTLPDVLGAVTKKGTIRKRKAYDVPLSERKRNKVQSKVESHSVKLPCKEICKFKCASKINSEQRTEINAQFWALNDSHRKMFVMRGMKKVMKERERHDRPPNEMSRRENSYEYVLWDQSGEEIRVCKVFFLAVLGYEPKNDRILKSVRPSVNNAVLSPPQDERGRHENSRKVNREEIINHIKTFNPTVSHYRREHAPNRLYLPDDVTVKLMHTDFLEKFPDYQNRVSYELYRQEVVKMNISFTKLGHEECFQCEEFNVHCSSSSDGHSREQLYDSCEPCQKWKAHHEKYEEARKQYKIDAAKQLDRHELIVSADLQKVIMLPRADMFKEVIFTPRIIAFNESFVAVGSGNNSTQPLAVIWHEAIAGRKKSDIISTFKAFFLKNRDSKRIVIWLDNCAAQNKNWALYSFFIYAVNCTEWSLERLEIKYFETGHTFMSADSFHHQVELSMSRKKKIFDFADFSAAVKAAKSGKTDVFEMSLNDFLDMNDYKSAAKLKKLADARPMMHDFQCVLFERGKRLLSYKNNFTDPYDLSLDYLTTQAFRQGPQPKMRTSLRGITVERKENLISKLRGIIPASRLVFWASLPTTNNRDESLDD